LKHYCEEVTNVGQGRSLALFGSIGYSRSMSMFPPEQVPEWTLADRLIKARTQVGLSQEGLAEFFGVTRATINRYERGRNVPPGPTLKLWALRCGVPLHWLRYGDTPPQPEVVAKTIPAKKRAAPSTRWKTAVAA
jgi:DNA-binding XRE family transcriptional regulator